jgi:hypothetical protein
MVRLSRWSIAFFLTLFRAKSEKVVFCLLKFFSFNTCISVYYVQYSKHFIQILTHFNPHCEVGIISVFILEIKKLRNRGIVTQLISGRARIHSESASSAQMKDWNWEVSNLTEATQKLNSDRKDKAVLYVFYHNR